MKEIIIKELESILDRFKSDNTYLTEEEQQKTLKFLREVSTPYMNATEASEYIGVCRKTFDNYVKQGFIPKGIERSGSKEKLWLKIDLEKWKQEMKKKT